MVRPFFGSVASVESALQFSCPSPGTPPGFFLPYRAVPNLALPLRDQTIESSTVTGWNYRKPYFSCPYGDMMVTWDFQGWSNIL